MANKQKVIVFGGTGNTGPFIVQRAIDAGFEVTAFVRTPSKVSAELKTKIRIVQGDILKEDLVADAIKGQDIVLSALGNPVTKKPVFVMSNGTRNILSGMKKHKVKKLVLVSGALSLPGYWVGWFAKELIADHHRMYKILQEEKEDIDWVSVNPPMIKVSSTLNPEYRVKVDEVDGRFSVTTAEIADFMIKTIQQKKIFDQYVHCRVGLSSGSAYITTPQLKILAATIVLVSAGMIMRFFGLV